MKQRLGIILLIAGAMGCASSSYGAFGEVFNTSGTWTGRVDGANKYTGSSMAAAENACLAAMTSGTIVIKNSGGTSGQMTTKTNVIVDATGRTISSPGVVNQAALYARNSSNIAGRNFWLSSSDTYGIFFRTCNGQNVTGSGGTAWKTFRIDNCAGGTGYNATLGNPNDTGAAGARGSDNVETYGISGGSAGTITSNDRTDGCGTLLNYSSNFSITSNNGTRCDFGGGYAGFRTANGNGHTTVGTATSTSCGRGYFSVSGSGDCTISNMQTYAGGGVWLQTTYNTHINSGTLRGGCWAITAGSGNSINVVCQ